MEDTRMLPSIGMRCNVRRELELVVIMMLVLTVQRLSDQVDKHTITRKLLQGSARFTQHQAVMHSKYSLPFPHLRVNAALLALVTTHVPTTNHSRQARSRTT